MPMKCLLDMDGVIANFVEGVCRVHQRENPYLDEANNGLWDMSEIWKMSATEFWKATHSAEFWELLEPMPDAHFLVDHITKCFGEENVCVLSAPSSDTHCMPGKHKWLVKHFPQFKRRFLFGPAKEFCAAPYTVLVDDRDSNVDSFIGHGGMGVLVPRPWNRNYELSGHTSQFVADELWNLNIRF